jgi:hypothetical protein
MGEKPNLTDAERDALDNALHALDRIQKGVEEARAPIEAQLRPLTLLENEIDEQREVLLERAGVTVVGHCAICQKLLLEGERGSTPYRDAHEIVFCEKHGMTYGDLQSHWKESEAFADGDDEDEAEMRKDAAERVAAHLAAGGSLDDLMPVGTL